MAHAPRAETGLAVSGALGVGARKRRRSEDDAGEKDETVFTYFIGKPGRESPVFFQRKREGLAFSA
jgi:hypothetical protein